MIATTPFNSGPTYTLSIVSGDGRVAASATAATRPNVVCGIGGQAQAGAVLPVVPSSASDRRVYYLDGSTAVRWLAPDGSHGDAAVVPGGAGVGSTFAVSPDDRRIAVVTTDYSHNPVSYRIYVEDLPGGANHVEIFSATSNSVPWAVGWHAGKLVLGIAGSCTQGGGPFSGFPWEYHVVDPTTAVRSATLGSPSGCRIESLPSRAGAICHDSSGSFQELGWDGTSQGAFTFGPDQYFDLALSPGGAAAACCDGGGGVRYAPRGGAAIGVPGPADSLGFIDDDHLILGGVTAQGQTRIYTISTRTTTPVPALGIFLGRLPGGL